MIKNYKTIYLGKVILGNITFTHVSSQDPVGRIEAGANIPVLPFQRTRITLTSDSRIKNPARVIRLHNKKKA